MKAVFKISYYLRSNYRNKEGKCSVMIRISLNSKMINLGSSGLTIVPEKWDKKMCRMKTRTSEALNFNNKLDEITTSLNQIYDKLKSRDEVSIDKIKNIYLGAYTSKMTFLEVMEEYNNNAKEGVGIKIVKATSLRFNRVHRYFKEFLIKKNQVKDISLRELNHLMLDQFINFLKIEKKYTHNSAMKFVQHLKTVSNYAVKKELIAISSFLTA